jgi:hypothetical protein
VRAVGGGSQATQPHQRHQSRQDLFVKLGDEIDAHYASTVSFRHALRRCPEETDLAFHRLYDVLPHHSPMSGQITERPGQDSNLRETD